jgi:two-component system, sporulation sensor kinase E
MERLDFIEEMGFQIAHELRNPMTIIGGYARSALKKTSPQDINYKSLQIIASEIERMENLLNDFMNYLDTYENKVEAIKLWTTH